MVSGYFDVKMAVEERGIRVTFCNFYVRTFHLMKTMYGYYKGYIAYLELKRFIRHWVGVIHLPPPPIREWINIKRPQTNIYSSGANLHV